MDSEDEYLKIKQDTMNDHLYYPFLTQVHGCIRLMHCSVEECDYYEKLESVPDLKEL